MNYDLDAARAARAEKHGPAHTITLGGQTFTMPAELPFAFSVTLMSGTQDSALRALMVLLDGQYDAAVEAGMTPEDFGELLRLVPSMYGFADSPESPASASPSKPAGKRPRRTSSASTA